MDRDRKVSTYGMLAGIFSATTFLTATLNSSWRWTALIPAAFSGVAWTNVLYGVLRLSFNRTFKAYKNTGVDPKNDITDRS